MRCCGFGIIESIEHRSKRSRSRKSKNSRCTDAGNVRTGSQNGKPGNLRVFTFAELKIVTRNFNPSAMIRVDQRECRSFTGSISSMEDPNEKVLVVVTQLDDVGIQGLEEWVELVNVLGMADHANLVKLVGYCANDDEGGRKRLMVYECQPNSRSLDDHLHSSSGTPLTWNMRLKIAEDVARGLAYLHEELESQVIFRDVKPSNIVFDEMGNAKLSDFGLAILGPDEESVYRSAQLVGTVGYVAPEYMATGCISSKADVWSYGVLLYALITGRRAFDKNRPRTEQLLLNWVKKYKSDARKFKLILDPKLDVELSLKPAAKLASIANRCVMQDPKNRPKMSEVLEMIKMITAGAEASIESEANQTCFSKLTGPCCASGAGELVL